MLWNIYRNCVLSLPNTWTSNKTWHFRNTHQNLCNVEFLQGSFSAPAHSSKSWSRDTWIYFCSCLQNAVKYSRRKKPCSCSITAKQKKKNPRWSSNDTLNARWMLWSTGCLGQKSNYATTKSLTTIQIIRNTTKKQNKPSGPYITGIICMYLVNESYIL